MKHSNSDRSHSGCSVVDSSSSGSSVVVTATVATVRGDSGDSAEVQRPKVQNIAIVEIVIFIAKNKLVTKTPIKNLALVFPLITIIERKIVNSWGVTGNHRENLAIALPLKPETVLKKARGGEGRPQDMGNRTPE